MQAPSSSLLRAFSPLRQSSLPWTAQGCLRQQQSAFSTTAPMMKRNKGGQKTDMRITVIRYHLRHGLTPRPLRFSRNRALRHWTIHRAWLLHQRKLAEQKQLELERQYNSMAAACEALRLIDRDGLTAEDRMRLGAGGNKDGGEGKDMGRLYRIAMLKEGVWDGIPIEYARLQTEFPAREGWNHGWTR
ncbi:Mitochondrial ribosomal protein L28 [Teratosphaeria destructans]|uniref:Mitochondrial ribosomal protein L28 n=1 Tax=Teratosphaeria destructans TaxID=418781 RepID=A0A9W7VYB6_9PEZI|nr:Mitochondrial ribosomal protein L28 [Teratosphaeria destructans]